MPNYRNDKLLSPDNVPDLAKLMAASKKPDDQNNQDNDDGTTPEERSSTGDNFVSFDLSPAGGSPLPRFSASPHSYPSQPSSLNRFKVDYAASHEFVPGGGLSKSIGKNLDASVARYEGMSYVWGGKTASAGGFDCSGLVHQVVMENATAMNRKYGNVYDLEKMNGMMNQSAADQVHNISQQVGGFYVNAGNTRQLTEGMIIGVTRNNVPGWAAGRPGGISHIGVVVNHNDHLMIAESAGSGVKYTDMNKWMNYSSVNSLYATNPFAVTTAEGKQILADAFKPGDDAKPKTEAVASSTTKSPSYADSAKKTGAILPSTDMKPRGFV